MESRKSVHKLAETIHSLLGWKSHLTSNWVKSVCDIMKSVPSEVSATDFKPTAVKTKDSTETTDDELCNAISKIEGELSILTAYINQLNTQRKQVLNEFLDLRGNIRVFCRIRPIAIGEDFGRLRPIAALDSSNIFLKLAENKKKTYSFDKVFHPGSSQDEVFAEVEPVIKSALDGYNACIFAYGQTGTGKSFTMEGTSHSPGVVPRAVEAIFKQAVDSNHVFLFSFSMLEIYLGNLKDLLVPQPTKAMDPMSPCLSIQTDPKGGIEIDNLVAIRVTDFNQALRLYKLGCRFRSTASTNSNITSSRSHCLIRLSITCFDAPERRRETNKIWFIDLGGSERVLKTKAWGRRLDEGKAINLSLSALGDVIHALQKKNFHVPYRNSKLTQVLKDSLGEDSKTLMLVHVSPKEEDLCETVCSLNFATRVRSIHLGNTDSTEERKQREIAITNLQQQMRRIEDECQDVRRSIKKLNEELERITGTAPSSNEQLDASHLLTECNQHNLERMRSKTTMVTTGPLSRIPRFMKPTVSSKGKYGVDDHSHEYRVKVPARRRRASSHRAESVSFPVKRISEYRSECSISRNSCLVGLNVKSNADSETEYSQDTTECEIKNVIVSEQEMSSKGSVQQKDSIVNSDRYGKGKKNSSSSTNSLKVDNWLRLHKNEPTISNVSHKSKRVLAIPIPEKKRANKKEKDDNLPNRNDQRYKFTKNKIAEKEKLEQYADAAGFGRSKQDIDIHKLPINVDGFINRNSSCNSICSIDQFDGETTTICARNLIDMGFIEEHKFGSSPPEIWCTSLNMNQGGDWVNKIFAVQEENGRKQCSDSISQDNNTRNLSSPSDSMSPDNEHCELSPSKLAHTMFDTKEDSCSSFSVLEKELGCPQVPKETGTDNSKSEGMDTADQSSTIWLRLGIHNMRTQRALFLGEKNSKEPLMAMVKSEENTENSGICNLLIGKVQIFWAGALLVLGLQNLGLEDEFFERLVL